jgi:hypothetical protein
MLVLKWSWVHHVYNVEDYDSYDEAVSSAGWASDYGEEALDCIEVWEDDGTYRKVESREVLDSWYDRQKEEEAAAPPRPPVVAALWVTGPDGKDANYSTYNDRAKADADAVRFREHLGADRTVEVRSQRH